MGVRAIQSAKDERENNGTAGQSTQNQEHVICQSQILMVTLINYVFQDVLVPPFPLTDTFGFAVSLPAASKSSLERRDHSYHKNHRLMIITITRKLYFCKMFTLNQHHTI